LLGAAVPRDQILLYLGRMSWVGRSALLEGFYRDIGWEGDRARSLLFLAEIARRQGDTRSCHTSLEAASAWILYSGSVEHLCLSHLKRARFARVTGETEAAQRAVDEGLHVARQHSLGSYHVELLCEQAEICLGQGAAEAAEQAASAAWERAWGANCQFMWGAAEAGHFLGRALAAQRRNRDAQLFLEKTLILRRRIGHPNSIETKKLLKRVR